MKLACQEPAELQVQNAIGRYLSAIGGVNLTVNPKLSHEQYLALMRVAMTSSRGPVAWFYRSNVGMARPGAKGDRMSAYGVKGMGDFTCRLRIGKTLYVEAKRRLGKQSEVQKMFAALERTYGQEYIVARSVGDVQAYFDSVDRIKVGVA